MTLWVNLVHWQLHWVLFRVHGLQNPPLSRWVELSFTPWLAGRSSRTSFYTVFDSVAALHSVIIWWVFVAILFPAYAIVHVLRIGSGETRGDTGGCAASRWDVACSSRLPLSELLVVMRKTNASLWLVISSYSVNDSQLCSPIFHFFSVTEYKTIITNVFIAGTRILLQYISPGIGYRQVIHNTNNSKKEKCSFSCIESEWDLLLQWRCDV